MHQGAFHRCGDHQPLPASGTLVDIQHRGDGSRSMAVRTLDGHAPSSLIDDEVIAAGLTFEEDIGHRLTLKGGTVSV
jgi:hypothetical protein